jgi:hypothetical protein
MTYRCLVIRSAARRDHAATRVGNVLLITAQRPVATQVAACRTWQSVGRQVRREERGI